MARRETSAPAPRITTLSDEHCREIEAALPAGVDYRPVLSALDEIVRGFLIFRERRSRRPPAHERVRWARIVKTISRLAAEVRQLKRETLWSDPYPEWPAHFLAELRNAQRHAETLLAVSIVSHLAVRGKRDEYREFLYWGVLRAWTDHAGGKLAFSKPAQRRSPGGPCIRFFLSVVTPILGDETPGPHGVAAIIRRERTNRRYTNVQIAQLKAKGTMTARK